MKSRKVLGGIVAGLLLVGGLGGGLAMAQQSSADAPSAAQHEADEEVQEPSYTGSIMVDDAQYEGMSEDEEAAALEELAVLSAADAEAAALAANPGTTAVQVELDNENGVVVYSVELSNGLDVKVDAGNGQILHTEQSDEDDEGNDQDNSD